ncbi:hypothetical protein [Pedobacter sp. SYSU D00535]|uniref:hypothetical protein n=1 Tax=Pedobacter sp. SYSU D00535 TaxID=2810308 RepID=UPI001A95E447|nr:hypothetical protein [Pedobacter sp. SYSU D00535]
MKKTIVSALFVLALIVNGFATDKNKFVSKELKVASTVQNSFKARYKNAQDVQWSEVDGYYKASFTLDGLKKAAYFDRTGKYVATSDYIKADALPTSSVVQLKNNYKDYRIDQVLRYEVESSDVNVLSDEGSVKTYYFVSLSNTEKHIAVKVSPDNAISYYKSF